MPHRVFYMARTPPDHRAVTLSVQPPEFADSWLESDDPAELRAQLAAADFIVTGAITAEQIALAERVRLIQMPGVGYERIDVAAAEARGIPVAITPEGTCAGVAEHTVMMMLALYKHLTEAHTALKQGEWLHNRLRPICLMLEGKRVGIVGLGRIGREVAARLRGWGVELVYCDLRRLPPEQEVALGVRYLPLDELLATADIVTLHVFLAEGSRHLIGARELALMKPSAVLINTARGEVVDEAALYAALAERRIQAAGLDVFAVEPVAADHPLLALDNVLLTPHMATANRDAMIAKARACYENFQRVLRGAPPINVVRPYGVVAADAAAG
jgi:phosphoglycerate dehydrogenase-like enzyme